MSASIRRSLRVRRERLNVGLLKALPLKPFTFYGSPFTNDKDGLFEHPAGVFSSRLNRADHRNFAGPKWLFSILLKEFRFDQVEDLACRVA